MDAREKIIGNVLEMFGDRAYSNVVRGSEPPPGAYTHVKTKSQDTDTADATTTTDDDADVDVTVPEVLQNDLRASDRRELGETRIVASALTEPLVAGAETPSPPPPRNAHIVLALWIGDPRHSKIKNTPVADLLAAHGSVNNARNLNWAPGVNYLRAVATWMRAREFRHAVLIFKSAPTSFVLNAITKECADLCIETFQRTYFLFSVVRHTLVPRHRALDRAEADAFMKRYGVQAQNLETLLVSDPVAQWYRYEPGQLVLIERRYGDGLVAPTVRVVA